MFTATRNKRSVKLPAVLVTDAHTVGATAVIRSLGRAGYNVIGSSERSDAIGLRSRYCTTAISAPPYINTSDHHGWLKGVISRHSVQCIIPSEAFLFCIEPWFDEFAHLVPYGSSRDTIYSCFSKRDLFTRTALPPADRALCERAPRFADILKVDDIAPASNWTYPVFVKTDRLYSTNSIDGRTLRAADFNELIALATDLLKSFSRVFIQEYVPGMTCAVQFLRWEGRYVASFMQRYLHELPHRGGISVLRESWMDQRIYDDAMARMNLLDLNGVAEFEYRWNPDTGDYWLMELNSRFWMSLHVALFAGIDFPRLLVECFFGHPPKSQLTFPIGVRGRHTFPLDAFYVWSRIKDPDLSLREKIWSVFEFPLLGIDPRVGADMLFPGDSHLYWLSVAQFMRQLRSRS